MLHHPKFEAARALLLNPPTFPDYDGDETRMRAGVSALALLASEAAALLIDMLDDLEPDADLEPSFGDLHPGALDEAEPDHDKEPSLGWTVAVHQSGVAWAGPPLGMDPDLEEQFDDREDNHDAEHDPADSEWSLGWTGAVHQGRGDQGLESDREDDGDDLEPSEDGEFNMGRYGDAGTGRQEAEQMLRKVRGRRRGQQLVYIGELRGEGFIPFGPVIPV